MVRGGGQGAVLGPTPYNDSLEIIIKAYYQYSHSSRRLLLHRVDAEADREEARGGDSSSPLVPPPSSPSEDWRSETCGEGPQSAFCDDGG
jgi:hypothetical protein